MLHEFGLGDEFLALLYRGDQLLAEAVAAAGCPHCGGPLHQANYPRKPRGGRLFEALGAFTLRRSMCCGLLLHGLVEAAGLAFDPPS